MFRVWSQQVVELGSEVGSQVLGSFIYDFVFFIVYFCVVDFVIVWGNGEISFKVGLGLQRGEEGIGFVIVLKIIFYFLEV